MGTRGSDAVSGPRFTWAAKALEQQPLKVAQHPCPRWGRGRRPGCLCVPIPRRDPKPGPKPGHEQGLSALPTGLSSGCSAFKACLGSLACDHLKHRCPLGWEDPGPQST